MILDIRGTSGSGKSYVAHQLLSQAFRVGLLLLDGGTREHAYALRLIGVPRPVILLGRYQSPCGGVDALRVSQDDICNLVRRYATQGHVLFEGLLVSHLYSRYRDLARELSWASYRFAFLDTPLEVCLERVQARRIARGTATELNPKNTIDKWYDIQKVYRKLLADGLDAQGVVYTQSVET